MKVEKVSATIRYSQDTGHGAWKVIELGAEASVSDREFWKQAQSELYYQLTDQLRTLWSNNDTAAALNGQNGAESHVEPPAEPAQVTVGRNLDQNIGAQSTERPTLGRTARVGSRGTAIRHRTRAGAGNSKSPLRGSRAPGEGFCSGLEAHPGL